MTTREALDDVLDPLPDAQPGVMVKRLARARGRASTDMAAVLALVQEWAAEEWGDDELILQELAASNAPGLSLRDPGT